MKNILYGSNEDGMKPIDFISALDGKILLHANEEIVSRSANVDELAGVFARHGTKNCIVSSSVDFSEEEGFPKGDAMDLVEKAIEKSKHKPHPPECRS